MSRGPVLIALLLFPALAVAQDDYAAADAAVAARAVLEKHCLTCHGDKPIRTTVKVLDHTGLTAPKGPDRPIPFIGLKPKDVSLALDLIKEGSMPPGSLPKVPNTDIEVLEKWVATGSGFYPEKFNEEFAHKAILADIGKVEYQNKPNTRYLSLHHLAAAAPGELGTARSQFLKGLENILGTDTTFHRVADTADTIYRINLVEAGWDYAPFFTPRLDKDAKGKEKEVRIPVKANLFDLVLLEYPHAVVPREPTTAFSELAKKFLVLANQVRPVPYVRGDWFVAVTMEPSLAKDLELLVKLRIGKLPPALRTKEKPPPPHVRKVPPADGEPLPALDAWYDHDGKDPPDPGMVKGVSISVLKVKPAEQKNLFLDDPNDTFRDSQSFVLTIAAEPSSYTQFVYIDGIGRVEKRSPVNVVPASGKHDYDLPEGGFAAPAKPVVQERLREYAAPHEFAAGAKWRAKIDNAEIERFVHPFFALDEKTGKVDLRDASIVRKSITIKVVK